jgi:hypothetical protein
VLAAPPGRAASLAPETGAWRASVLPGAASWWAEPGRPGARPGAWLDSGFPPGFGGLVLGGLEVADLDGTAPHGPWPPTVAETRPVAVYDSLELEALPLRAGLGAPVARLVAGRAPPPGPRARALFGFTSGDYAVEETSLLAERLSRDRVLRIETVSATRGDAGPLGLAGRHAWSVFVASRRGDHRVEGSYAQRGAAQQLATGSLGEASGGEAGHLAWRWERGERHAGLTLERAHTFRESFGFSLPYSRRDADENRVRASAGVRRGPDAVEVEARFLRARVRRAFDGEALWRADAWSAGTRASRALGDGAVEAELALARDGALGGARVAPALAYRFQGARVRGGASVARLLAPAWSDLPSGEEAFLQRTWAGGLEVAARGRAASVGVSFTAGLTHDRAVVLPGPLADVWLRAGLARDAGRSAFALSRISVGWQPGRFDLGGEGFALARSGDGATLDPPRGARAHAAAEVSLFGGDLRLAARAEVEAQGPRTSPAPREVRIPGYASAGGTLTLRLADVTLAIRARNLEDRRRAEPWIDPDTGIEALGPGREVRFTMTWLLND